MSEGDSVMIRIDSIFKANLDIATAPPDNLKAVTTEQLSANISGLWFRVNYPL